MTMEDDREALESQQKAEARQEQREWLRVALSSIGDAVITTDTIVGDRSPSSEGRRSRPVDTTRRMPA